VSAHFSGNIILNKKVTAHYKRLIIHFDEKGQIIMYFFLKDLYEKK